MSKRIAVIEGDDASPEAMRPCVALLEQVNQRDNLGIEWVYPCLLYTSPSPRDA